MTRPEETHRTASETELAEELIELEAAEALISEEDYTLLVLAETLGETAAELDVLPSDPLREPD